MPLDLVERAGRLRDRAKRIQANGLAVDEWGVEWPVRIVGRRFFVETDRRNLIGPYPLKGGEMRLTADNRIPARPPQLSGPVWSPLPRRPWSIRLPDGRLFRRFDSAAAASDWLTRNGYSKP